ncbi:NAD(P)-dependent oxidoreductase [Neobacillus sp. DY30]|uniref:precorrin-2 dehydrogenase/sirohydrochlorin ferrochelatase family protein n=1 Tax=Neobacillus sp. DY30 TaxID=3047871 RepID=UPI0024C04759|nr:NAD(P)-dependent oxidoreductase [Neobacillus sp. DY30]WHY01063.1 NAD(P)-dependent oxidoreductase [Neobacillus sp. DY30]
MLKLEGKKVVVVGGGKVAERKVTGLIGTGSLITVISPNATDELKGLAGSGRIEWLEKSFAKEDIDGAFLIFAATNDSKLNQLIKNAVSDQQLVTIADDPEGSDFHVPAHIQRGRLSIAVSTGGASPTLARKLREQLEQQFVQEFEDYLEFLFSARQRVLKEVKEASRKRKILSAIASEEFLNSQNREADFLRLLQNTRNDV